MRVVVTGAAGYIGGETSLKLLDAGHTVFGIDQRVPPMHLRDYNIAWLTGDFIGEVALDNIKRFNADAIIHCAGTSLVGPSVANPRLYYNNNFVKTKQLVDYLLDNKINLRLIFSSSASVYGEPTSVPCFENAPLNPISPYGESKLMIEWMLDSYRGAYGFDSVSFRYFNACGADSLVRHGQEHGATHIIARVLESLKSKDGKFVLNGNKFFTEDGTCIRDYIHVEDLAQAHIAALDLTVPGGSYNLGTNQGTSNLEVITTASGITLQSLDYTLGPMRSGDPAVLTADATKCQQVSAWRPQFNLRDMIQHAWNWYNK